MKHTSMRKMLFALAVVAGSFGFGASVFAADPANTCNATNEGAFTQTYSTRTTRGGQLSEYTKWQCVRPNARAAGQWEEVGDPSTKPFSGVNYDSSVPAEARTTTTPPPTGSPNPTTPPPTGSPNPTTPPPTGSPNPSSGSGSQSTTFSNPLRHDTVQEVLGSLLDALQGIIVTLSIIFIIIGAILYITSAGDSKKTESAKHAITAAMIGLALGIAAPSFLKEIYTIVGGKSCSGSASDVNDVNCVDISATNGSLSLTEIALRVLDFLLGITGIISIIMLIIGALMYLSSAGDEGRLDKGKEIVTYSIIGITVALAAMVIVRQIATFF